MKQKINTRCIGCGHRRPVSDCYKESYCICHYILDTGKPRGCTVEKCTHYTTEQCHMLSDDELLQRSLFPQL